ncbi:phosphotransferase family protein [Nonomuraea guangzhouensis]|uniref:Phosphotransferase family protein n=1 Tax=Nonomuraea guangzhouensis TaxID=1291555 RepID=A0ABW4GF06_9ACTN
MGLHRERWRSPGFDRPSRGLARSPSDVRSCKSGPPAARHPWARGRAYLLDDVLSDEERQFLSRKEQELRAAYETLSLPLAAGAVHDDAHSDNLIKATDGTVVLIDLERFAFGPPETDLAVIAIEHSLGWGTRAEYNQFAERYGFDVLTWEGYPVLRDINELKMTTWLMQNVSEDKAIAREFRNRLFCLQNPDAPRRWRAF